MKYILIFLFYLVVVPISAQQPKMSIWATKLRKSKLLDNKDCIRNVQEAIHGMLIDCGYETKYVKDWIDIPKDGSITDIKRLTIEIAEVFHGIASGKVVDPRKKGKIEHLKANVAVLSYVSYFWGQKDGPKAFRVDLKFVSVDPIKTGGKRVNPLTLFLSENISFSMIEMNSVDDIKQKLKEKLLEKGICKISLGLAAWLKDISMIEWKQEIVNNTKTPIIVPKTFEKKYLGVKMSNFTKQIKKLKKASLEDKIKTQMLIRASRSQKKSAERLLVIEQSKPNGGNNVNIGKLGQLISSYEQQIKYYKTIKNKK